MGDEQFCNVPHARPNGAMYGVVENGDNDIHNGCTSSSDCSDSQFCNDFSDVADYQFCSNFVKQANFAWVDGSHTDNTNLAPSADDGVQSSR